MNDIHDWKADFEDIRSSAHEGPYQLSKAEIRRQRRGVGLHSPIRNFDMEARGVVVALADNSRWRIYFRGGKSFPRRLAWTSSEK